MSCAISMGFGDMDRIISRDSARRVGVVGVIGIELVASNSSVGAIWLSGGSCVLISLLEKPVSRWSITANRIQVLRLRIHGKRALVMISNGDSLILPTYSRFERGASLKNASDKSSCREIIAFRTGTVKAK
jgi:hypothetical protein